MNQVIKEIWLVTGEKLEVGKDCKSIERNGGQYTVVINTDPEIGPWKSALIHMTMVVATIVERVAL